MCDEMPPLASFYANVPEHTKMALWKFLCQPENIRLMIDATNRGRPAAEPLGKIPGPLTERFGEADCRNWDNTMRQMFGHMIKQIMWQKGYQVENPRVSLRRQNLLSTAARYESRE